MIRYLFIHLTVQDGEREHDHRVLHTTTAKNLDFVAERFAASYWGQGKYDRHDECWYVEGGTIAIGLEKYQELTKAEYNFLKYLFY